MKRVSIVIAMIGMLGAPQGASATVGGGGGGECPDACNASVPCTPKGETDCVSRKCPGDNSRTHMVCVLKTSAATGPTGLTAAQLAAIRAAAAAAALNLPKPLVYPACPAGWSLAVNKGADSCSIPPAKPACPKGKTLKLDGSGTKDTCQ